MTGTPVHIIDLGRLPYAQAYERQVREVEQVLAARAEAEAGAPSPPGVVLLVEHDPVITITPRQSAAANLIATPELLARAGVAVAPTDRGGDITYHGPGQLVVYPILDLNRLNLGLHAYMRLLEQTVIDTCDHFGIAGHRDPTATGVWITPGDRGVAIESFGVPGAPAKIAAMGVRVRKWISMHGLALNVTTNLDHFRLIVPCGLAGRPVTSLEQILGPACPSIAEVKAVLTRSLVRLIEQAQETAAAARGVGAAREARAARGVGAAREARAAREVGGV